MSESTSGALPHTVVLASFCQISGRGCRSRDVKPSKGEIAVALHLSPSGHLLDQSRVAVKPKRYMYIGFLQTAIAAIILSAAIPCSGAEPARLVTLRIGATGTLTGAADSLREKAGNDLLERFVKEETGLNAEIKGQLDWEVLAAGLKKGELHFGVFQGYEFAWLQEKHSDIKPLAVAINTFRYPIACIVTQAKSPIKSFADLQGKSIAVPASCHACLRMFVDRQAEAAGKKAEDYFSSIASPESVEDCLDDIVDGKIAAGSIDEAALEAYKRRKPGRFKQLKEVTRSPPFPPIVVAYHGTTLDAATISRFKDSLMGAARKEKGELLLSLSRLTAFESVPDDFVKVLADTRKAFPASAKK
jgi:ABC-type phosphate/phosphonate transport system substrate-binding protein